MAKARQGSCAKTPGRWLGVIGNWQVCGSVHAVGRKGTVALGSALYLPEDWCGDPERRRAAKIPAEGDFKTKPELGIEIVKRACSWEVPVAPVPGDQAYGDNSELRERLHESGEQYVLSVGRGSHACSRPRRCSRCPRRSGKSGRSRKRLRPDRRPAAFGALIVHLGRDSAKGP